MGGLKIYFCGSIRGGREDAAVYRQMIEKLKEYGNVLTEHVGDASLTEFGGDGGSDYIWKRDTEWLSECDVVIAECSRASLGVGYELAFAQAHGKPVFVFYGGEEGRLSAMIEGCPDFSVRYYGEGEAIPALTDVMEGFLREKAKSIRR